MNNLRWDLSIQLHDLTLSLDPNGQFGRFFNVWDPIYTLFKELAVFSAFYLRLFSSPSPLFQEYGGFGRVFLGCFLLFYPSLMKNAAELAALFMSVFPLKNHSQSGLPFLWRSLGHQMLSFFTYCVLVNAWYTQCPHCSVATTEILGS